MPPVQPISLFLSWPPSEYMVRSTDHEPRYVISCSRLNRPPPSVKAQISSSVACYRKLSAYVSPSMYHTTFHTHIKQPEKLLFSVFYFVIFYDRSEVKGSVRLIEGRP